MVTDAEERAIAHYASDRTPCGCSTHLFVGIPAVAVRVAEVCPYPPPRSPGLLRVRSHLVARPDARRPSRRWRVRSMTRCSICPGLSCRRECALPILNLGDRISWQTSRKTMQEGTIVEVVPPGQFPRRYDAARPRKTVSYVVEAMSAGELRTLWPRAVNLTNAKVTR